MKLSFGVLAALAGVNEAVVTCTSGDLFEASCDSAGIKILIKEACRAEKFAGIDFPNSFVWGDAAVTTMAVPGCAAPCTPVEVVVGTAATCSSAKPSTGAGADYEDSNGDQTYRWLVPFDECGVTATLDNTDVNNVFTKYDLYLNANSAVDTANAISQMEQVKFTCKLEPFQEDAGVVTITQGDLVEDDAFKLDLRSLVELKVSTAAADTAQPSAAASYDGKTAMMTVTEATTASMGDHVELRLKDVTGQTATTAYALSLYKCWASKAEKASTAGESTLTDTLTTTTDTALEFQFWDEFCPLYNWVAPESGASTGNGYLKTHWDRASSLHAINFRQFAFLSTDFTVTSDTTTTDSIHYHCFVKVCPLTDETTCSTKKLDNNPNVCTAPTYYNPAGRRRRDAELERTRRSDLDGSTLVEVTKTITTKSVAPEDCHTIVNGACIVQKDETPRSSSKHIAAATGLAAFMTAINL